MRPQFQDALKRLGISNKPVWLTIRTDYSNSPESQAADIFRRIVRAYGHGDAMAMWHT